MLLPELVAVAVVVVLVGVDTNLFPLLPLALVGERKEVLILKDGK
jgi:hypothetical protein